MDRNVFKLWQNINKDIKSEPESYNTGLVGEALIISAYKQMTIDKLEKIAYIVHKIIKKKKEMERVRLNAGNLDKLVSAVVVDDQQKPNK